ncbi:MAG: NUDIX domain-containing protein [Polyangiaceae bacterium]
MDERIAVVDEQNRFVRWSDRAEVHKHRLVHRTIHVLVLSSDGERLLLQRRHRDKRTHPNHWDLSCAGHVDPSDETSSPDLDRMYLSTALRELREELGIDADVEPLGHFAPLDGVHYEQLRLFRARHDGPFVLQADEVEEVRFVTRDQLNALLDDRSALVTETLAYFAPLAIRQGWW